MDLESLLVSLYVLVDDWWQRTHPPAPRKPGRPPSLSTSEVLTLAVLSQWPRWRSERDFFRFAQAHLHEYFPNLLSYGQLNRRIRALEPEIRALQRDLAETSPDRRRATTYWLLPSSRPWLEYGPVVRVCLPDKRPSGGASPKGTDLILLVEITMGVYLLPTVSQPRAEEGRQVTAPRFR